MGGKMSLDFFRKTIQKRSLSVFLTAIITISSVFSACAPFAQMGGLDIADNQRAKLNITKSQTHAGAEQITSQVMPVSYSHENIPGLLSTETPQVPIFTIKPGENYFTIDNNTDFLFSRNIAAYYSNDFEYMPEWTAIGGSTMVRLQLPGIVMGGTGYNNKGELDEGWAKRWEQVFDYAEANHVYVMLVFSGWYDWRSKGFNNWAQNPFNSVNGGPAKTPHDLFVKDSQTQKLWLDWLKTLVTRWQSRRNIVIWEIFSEVNLSEKVTEDEGIYFVEQATNIIHAVDPSHRPLTASLADTGLWNRFYKSPALDFINIHPYPPSAKLDRVLINEVHKSLNTYYKPVLNGESGLNADTPENYPPNAEVGVRHAIWAGLVSGAMNGRALYWEDGYGLFFSKLSWPFVRKYNFIELPAVRFISGVDMSGFKPVLDKPTSNLFGAAVGNDKMVIGWYRDAASEPPEWSNQRVITKQSVTLTVPGTEPDWQVDFYDTKTGTDILSSKQIARTGKTITVILPDFKDDIAFKLLNKSYSHASLPTNLQALPVFPVNTNSIANQWVGTISNWNFSSNASLTIKPGCSVGIICGGVSYVIGSCTGDLFLKEIQADMFVFIEQNMTGSSSCKSGGKEFILLQPDGSLLLRYLNQPSKGDVVVRGGIFKPK
jgi:hypothetical protein